MLLSMIYLIQRDLKFYFILFLFLTIFRISNFPAGASLGQHLTEGIFNMRTFIMILLFDILPQLDVD